MQENQRSWRSVVAFTLAVVGLLVVATIPIAQADPKRSPKVLPLDSNAYGNTYSEWSARWIQWLLSIPATTNPALDTTGAECGEGQAGPVWFLAGTFGGSVTRSCTVPVGKALFFPIVNGFFGAGVFDCFPTVPSVTCNLTTLRVAAAASMDAVTLEAHIDGKLLPNLSGQRVQSPEFTITYPDDNVFGIQSGTYVPNVADGYWLMLAPLSAGAHTIHFKGEITGGVFAGTVIEATYHLTVEP
jgi:hypothetical protein